MAEFNPDEYLSSFNPDEYLGGATAPAPAAMKSSYASKEEALKHFGDTSQIPGSFKKYLQGLGYGYGVTKTGLAALASRVSGNGPISDETIWDAFKGRAHPLKDITAEKFPGANEGLTGLAQDAGEIMAGSKIDPLTNYANIVSRPISAGIQGQAQKVYNSSIPKIAAKSPGLMEEGLNSGASSLKDLIEKGLSGFRKQREPLLSQVREAGIEMSPTAFSRTEAEITRLRNEGGPTNLKVAEDLEAKLQNAKETMLPSEGKPGVGIDAVMTEKAGGVGAKPQAYDPNNKAYYNQANRSGKSYTQDMKAESERMTSEAVPSPGPGLPSGGEILSEINSKWGPYIQNRNKLVQALERELQKRNFSAVDGLLMGAGALPGAMDLMSGHKGEGFVKGALGAWAAKKGAQYWNKPDTRLSTGVMLDNAAQRPIWDEMARRALINSGQKLGE